MHVPHFEETILIVGQIPLHHYQMTQVQQQHVIPI